MPVWAQKSRLAAGVEQAIFAKLSGLPDGHPNKQGDDHHIRYLCRREQANKTSIHAFILLHVLGPAIPSGVKPVLR